MKLVRPSACIVAVLVSIVAAGAWASCMEPVAVRHIRAGQEQGGAIILSGTGYEDKLTPGPPMRFWAFDHHKAANSGTHNPYIDRIEWLIHPAIKYKTDKLKPGYWIVYQMNWMGEGIVGCIQSVEGSRTVVEMSFADPAREGTPQHVGHYLALSAPLDGSRVNLDLAKDDKGSNRLAVRPIPVPKIAKVAEQDGFRVASASVEHGVSYSEGGTDKPVKLIAGTRLYYAVGEEPKSSAPEGWKPVLDARDTSRELGLVPSGTGQVSFAVPKGSEAVWIAARIQYADATAELLSQAVSSHVPLKAGEGQGGAARRRDDGKRKR